MVTLFPIARALVPVDSAAAARIGARNYDEFQSDEEVWRAIRDAPESVLRITMAHCDAGDLDDLLAGDSDEALARATRNMAELRASPLTREVARVVYVYELVDPRRPGVRQIGLGGMARTAAIRTEERPGGTIIRNEGVRAPKARGRARLVEATRAFIGTVNLAVPDATGSLAGALERYADGTPFDHHAVDEGGVEHRIWLVRDPATVTRFQQRLSEEPEAYVADGNHRSAAAAMLGQEGFLAVFFPAARMAIAPYNRLVRLEDRGAAAALPDRLGARFDVGPAPGPDAYQPVLTHEIGLYGAARVWLRLVPRPDAFDPADAAASIDHDIVQRWVFAEALGIADPGDDRLTFVGAHRDAAWLQGEVDAGRADVAVTLPAVTMEQFVAVCRQRRMMPPKSTWFEPKIRSGLVMALLD